MSLGNVVVVVARKAAALSFCAEISTRSLFFTAWTAAALFGRGLHLWVTDDDDDDEQPRRTSTRALDLERFRRATKRLALTETQQVAVDQVVSQIQPLIVQLRLELKEKQQALVALQPGDNGFLNETGRISNDIGTLATQLALTSNKLKTDIYGILSKGQQTVLGDLQTAFEMVE